MGVGERVEKETFFLLAPRSLSVFPLHRCRHHGAGTAPSHPCTTGGTDRGTRTPGSAIPEQFSSHDPNDVRIDGNMDYNVYLYTIHVSYLNT